MPCGAHRDAVGDRDRVELHRRAAGGADALLDLLGEARAGGSCRASSRSRCWRRRSIGLLQVVVVEADALHVGARVGAVRAVEDDASCELRRGRRSRAGSCGHLAGRRAGAPTRRSAPRSRRTCAGSSWRPGEVHVGVADQRGRSSARQRHPLGEHVVGVGQPRLPQPPRRGRGSATQYSLSSSPLRGVVGDDRPVRVDQVAVARRRSRASPTRMKPRSRYIAQRLVARRPSAAARGRAARRGARGRGRRATAVRCAARGAALAARRATAERAAAIGGPKHDRRPGRVRGRAQQHRPRRGQPPGGAREEDHALGAARDLGEVADHRAPRGGRAGARRSAPRPTCPRRAGGGTPRPGAPRPRRRSGSPSASSTSPWPGFMRRNFMRPIMPSGHAAARAHRRPRAPRCAEHVDRARRPRRARAGRRAPPRRRSACGRARGLERRRARAPGARPAPRSGCSPSRAPRRPGGARPGISHELARRRRRGRSPSSRWPPVTTTRRGPERVHRARELLRRRPPRPARSARAPRGGSG